MIPFQNREDAGRQLVSKLQSSFSRETLLLAIPKGGILTAAPVAAALGCSISVVPIRPLALSWTPCNPFGYVTCSGETHLNQPLVGQLRLSRQEIYQMAKTERQKLVDQMESWGAALLSDLGGATVLIIDDGMHTGWTMFSAIETVKSLGAGKVTVAVPVSHFRANRFVSNHCDQTTCAIVEDTARFQISAFYQDFPPVTDEQIRAILSSSPPRNRQSAA
ncbi:MAG: phosphoribosyltransferase family protein [Acidobacteriota bacterium]